MSWQSPPTIGWILQPGCIFRTATANISMQDICHQVSSSHQCLGLGFCTAGTAPLPHFSLCYHSFRQHDWSVIECRKVGHFSTSSLVWGACAWVSADPAQFTAPPKSQFLFASTDSTRSLTGMSILQVMGC